MATYPSFYQTRAYTNLKNTFLQLQNVHMRDLFQADANRFDKMHINFENMLFDYAKNRLTAEAIQQLVDLANEMEEAAIDLAGQAERNEQETAKMRQLQQLLKSLG